MPEADTRIGLAFVILAVGIILVGISSLFFLLYWKNLELTLPKAFLLIGCFALVNYVLIVSRRSSSGLEHIELSTWYGMLMTPIWMSILFFGVYFSIRSMQQKTWHFYLNSMLITVLFGAYIYAGFTSAEKRGFFNARELDCIGNFPISRNINCFNPYWLNSEFTLLENGDLLAWNHLAIYAQPEYTSPLEIPSSVDAEWAIIDLPVTWQHLHLLRRLPFDIPQDRYIHFYDSVQPDVLSRLDAIPARYAFSDIELELGIDELDNLKEDFGESLWYIRTRASSESETNQALSKWLYENNYFPYFETSRDYHSLNLSVFHYSQSPDIYSYDDVLVLHSWHIEDVQSFACETKNVHKTWRLKKALSTTFDTYIALILVDADGNEISRGQTIVNPDWQEDWLHTSEMELDIPCGVDVGRYSLLATVFYYDQVTDTFIGNATIQDSMTMQRAFGYLTDLYVD